MASLCLPHLCEIGAASIPGTSRSRERLDVVDLWACRLCLPAGTAKAVTLDAAVATAVDSTVESVEAGVEEAAESAAAAAAAAAAAESVGAAAELVEAAAKQKKTTAATRMCFYVRNYRIAQ